MLFILIYAAILCQLFALQQHSKHIYLDGEFEESTQMDNWETGEHYTGISIFNKEGDESSFLKAQLLSSTTLAELHIKRPSRALAWQRFDQSFTVTKSGKHQIYLIGKITTLRVSFHRSALEHITSDELQPSDCTSESLI